MKNNTEEKMDEDSLSNLLRSIIAKLNNQNTSIDQLASTVKKLDESIRQVQGQPKMNVVVNTEPIEKIVKSGLLEMKMHMVSQPKALVKRFQILFFPEQDAKLFYKIIFGRWFMWLTVMLVFTLIFKWIIYREDIQRELSLERFKNDQIVHAWEHLYSQKDKKLHKLMDSTLIKVSKVGHTISK